MVCICRTISGMDSSASAGGRITMSTPSPRMFSSESVTSAATSISASCASDSPVISQSIHTIRSFMCLTLRGDHVVPAVRRPPRVRPAAARAAGPSPTSPRPGCSGTRAFAV